VQSVISRAQEQSLRNHKSPALLKITFTSSPQACLAYSLLAHSWYDHFWSVVSWTPLTSSQQHFSLISHCQLPSKPLPRSYVQILKSPCSSSQQTLSSTYRNACLHHLFVCRLCRQASARQVQLPLDRRLLMLLHSVHRHVNQQQSIHTVEINDPMMTT
jgi:hypothetical protein